MGWWIRGYKKHFHVNHGQHEFTRGNCPINGIESFWSYAKRRLAQFSDVPRKTSLLHLKECEFGFDHREENLYEQNTYSAERKSSLKLSRPCICYRYFGAAVLGKRDHPPAAGPDEAHDFSCLQGRIVLLSPRESLGLTQSRTKDEAIDGLDGITLLLGVAIAA